MFFNLQMFFKTLVLRTYTLHVFMKFTKEIHPLAFSLGATHLRVLFKMFLCTHITQHF